MYKKCFFIFGFLFVPFTVTAQLHKQKTLFEVLGIPYVKNHFSDFDLKSTVKSLDETVSYRRDKSMASTSSSEATYTFNQFGYVISAEITKEKAFSETNNQYLKYKYNKKTNLLETVTYYNKETDEIVETYTVVYSKENLPSIIIIDSKQDNVHTSILLEYSQGTLISYKAQDKNFVIEGEATLRYDNDSVMPSGLIAMDQEGEVKVTYKFNELNNIESELYVFSSDDFKIEVDYGYNEYGLLNSKTEDGETATFSYQYDANKNWVTQIKRDAIQKDLKITTKRTINYE